MSFTLTRDDGSGVSIDEGRVSRKAHPAGLRFAVGSATIHPGLINAHDHLHRNHYPRLGAPPYRDAYEWGADLHERFGAELARVRTLPREEALLFGALKNLLGGVTTVAHHDAWEPAFEHRFPIRVARTRVAHSPRLGPRFGDVARRDRRRHLPLCVHLAEGVTREAGAEVREAAGAGLLQPDVLAVHVVGVEPPDISLLRRSGAGVVWCPTSNRFLFGRTAPRELITAGMAVLLGTDALLTGDGTLLEELRAAHRLGYLDAADLIASVTTTAAAGLRVPPPSLQPGAPADLVVFGRPPLEAHPRDIRLVLVAGEPRYGDAEFADLFALRRVPVEPLTVGGVSKLVAAPMGSVLARVGDLCAEPLRILN